MVPKRNSKACRNDLKKMLKTELMGHAVFESHSEEVSFLHKKPILKKFSLGPLPVKGSVGPRSTMGWNIFWRRTLFNIPAFLQEIRPISIVLYCHVITILPRRICVKIKKSTSEIILSHWAYQTNFGWKSVHRKR